MTNAVKKQIQSLYKSGTRRFPAIMSQMKKAGTPVTMKEIGDALKEIRPAPAKKKTKKGRKKVAKKKASKKKSRKKTAKKGKKAAKKKYKKRGPGRPKGSKNKKKVTRRGRKAGAGRPSTEYLVTVPKGRGVSAKRVAGKAKVQAAIQKLISAGADPKKIEVFSKVKLKVETQTTISL